jgi:CRP/FNR family transcriptional regulator
MCTKRVPIFATLEAEELRRVANLILRKEYVKGELIIMEGERFDNLVIINQGQVKAFRNTTEGKEQILYIFSEGDFFGEKNILREKESAYHVEALEKTKICMINKKDFQTLLHELPEIGIKIIDELSNRIDRLENTIQSMGMKNVDVRINTVLLEFAKKYGRNSDIGLEIDLPLSREGIANYIGLTRETVSRKLSSLQEEGIIEMSGNKKIILLDQNALEELIE